MLRQGQIGVARYPFPKTRQESPRQVGQPGQSVIGDITGCPGDVAAEDYSVSGTLINGCGKTVKDRGIRSLAVASHPVVAKVGASGSQVGVQPGIEIAVHVG